MTIHMQSIVKYSELINSIPVFNQSAIIKLTSWERVSYQDKLRIEKAIFGNTDEVELSRADIFSEDDTKKRIIMVLMWGYPTGGRGNNIESILTQIDKLAQLLSSVEKQNLTEKQADNLINELMNIRGLGISTWSKFLYFFNVSINARKCQIYDLKIELSLNTFSYFLVSL